jgi:micrococcal nuclease
MSACVIMASVVDAGQPRWLEGEITYVRDIDTFEVNGIPIRLDGVDGPEYKERDGRAAKRWLQITYGGAKVRCWLDGTTTYDRHVGICYDRTKQDIGAVIIAMAGPATALGTQTDAIGNARPKRAGAAAKELLPVTLSEPEA